ncbi:MAG: VanZ family protein [Polyangia bacterium]
MARQASDNRGGRSRNGRVFFWASIAYVAVIAACSHIPGASWSSLGVSVWDKAVHFVEYAPLGALLTLWLAVGFSGVLRGWGVVIAAVAIVAGLGALDELHQAFVSNRTASFGDALADALGGAAGALLARLLYLRSAPARGDREPLSRSPSRTT